MQGQTGASLDVQLGIQLRGKKRAQLQEQHPNRVGHVGPEWFMMLKYEKQYIPMAQLCDLYWFVDVHDVPKTCLGNTWVRSRCLPEEPFTLMD